MKADAALNLSLLAGWVHTVLSTGPLTTSTLAAAAGKSTRSIRLAVEQLRQAGVEVIKRGQKTVVTPENLKEIKAEGNAALNGSGEAIEADLGEKKTGNEIGTKKPEGTGEDVEEAFEREMELLELGGLELRGRNETD